MSVCSHMLVPPAQLLASHAIDLHVQQWCEPDRIIGKPQKAYLMTSILCCLEGARQVPSNSIQPQDRVWCIGLCKQPLLKAGNLCNECIAVQPQVASPHLCMLLQMHTQQMLSSRNAQDKLQFSISMSRSCNCTRSKMSKDFSWPP